MSNRPLLTGLFVTQIVFALACTGGASLDGRSAGDDVQLDDTPPPSVDERPDLQGDDRCDWLGSPFATPHDDRVYVLRSTDDERDCDRQPRADRKLLFSLHGSSATPLLDLSELSDVRMLGTNAGLLLLSETSDSTEHVWRIDPATGSVLEEANLFATIRRTATAPSGRWVALGEDGLVNDQLLIQVLDPADLSLTGLSVEGRSGAYTWLANDQLVTAGFLDDALRLRVWDFSGEAVPTAPVREVTVEGVGRTWMEATLAVSGNQRHIAIPATEGDAGVAVLWDLEQDTTSIVGRMTGPFAYTDDDTLLGYDGEDLRLVAPDGAAHTVELDEPPEVVVAPHGKHLLVGGWTDGLQLLSIDDDALVPLTGDDAIGSHTLRGTDVWLTSDDGLRRIDLYHGEHELFEGPTSRRTLWLPATDELYLDEAQAPVVHFLDPETAQPLRTIDLGGEFMAAPRLEAL